MKLGKTMLWIVIMVAFFSHPGTGQTPLSGKGVGLSDRLDAVRTLIDSTTKKADQERDVAARFELYQQASAQMLRVFPNNHAVKELLKRTAAQATETANREQAAGILRDALREAQEIVAFKPHIESPMPEGFPAPTPVGEIQLKQYPVYRLALTPMAGTETGAFWTLFTHIKKKDIAMTAPVEMTYGEAGKKGLRVDTMAFLYRSTKQGQAGEDEKVKVMDVQPIMALSLGIRGDITKARLADAKAQLDAWLMEHSKEYEANGPLRVMGYNSPFVAASRRFSEVELPVRRKSPDR